MNPSHPFPATAPASEVAVVPPVDRLAIARLNHSRTRMAEWLAADRAKRSRPSLAGWAASAAWPLIKGLREHPSASLALGALAQGLLRPAAPPNVQGPTPLASPPAIPQVLAQGLALVRRHPKTAVAVTAAAAGAVWLWSRSSTPRPPQP